MKLPCISRRRSIDRASVSPGIVRTLRDGWRTINCAVFITDERGAFDNSPIHSSPDHHFCTSRKLFVFFPFFSVCTNSLFKKEKLAKSILLNASDSHKNFFLNRCVMKHYAISNGHIGDGHREIHEIGVHRPYSHTAPG
jgi:hypothetical protein